jgi:hypothetical protein
MQASQTASQTVDATANSATNTSVDTVATLQDQLVGMGEGFVRALPGIAIALVVLLVTWIVARFAARIASSEPSSSSKPSGCTMTSIVGEWLSSRSSMGVNLTCAGPRRAKTCTSFATFFFRPS